MENTDTFKRLRPPPKRRINVDEQPTPKAEFLSFFNDNKTRGRSTPKPISATYKRVNLSKRAKVLRAGFLEEMSMILNPKYKDKKTILNSDSWARSSIFGGRLSKRAINSSQTMTMEYPQKMALVMKNAPSHGVYQSGFIE